MKCIPITGGSASDPQQFIFGYGSLVEDESREGTTPSAVDAWPARVKGLRRGWWARGGPSGMTTTYLGALDDATSSINGVLYAVTTDELAATDARETAGYQRCIVPIENITMLDGRSQPLVGIVWVNDRLYPRRPFIAVPNASKIDAALLEAPRTRDLFYEIELEPASWEDRKPVRPPVPASR